MIWEIWKIRMNRRVMLLSYKINAKKACNTGSLRIYCVAGYNRGEALQKNN